MILQPWHHALLPAAARAGRGHDEGDGPVDVEPAHHRPRQGAAGDLASWPRRSRPSTGSRAPDGASGTAQARSTRFLEVYNAAWERNWGFVPLTEEEVAPLRQGAAAGPRRELGLHRRAHRHRRGRRRRADAARLQPGARAAATAGCCRSAGGTACASARKIDACACFALGVKPAYQHTGVAARFYADALRRRRAHAAEGRRDGLDPRDEPPMNRAMEGDGRARSSPLPRLRARAVEAGLGRPLHFAG